MPTPSLTDYSLDGPSALKHSDSNGFISLERGDKQRRQGSSLIARQVEAENMKARQLNAKQRASEKSLQIQDEQRMNQYLDHMNHESHKAEQWQNNMKR